MSNSMQMFIFRCYQTVTFWDSLAEEFELALKTVSVHPAIVIVASAKITSWQSIDLVPFLFGELCLPLVSYIVVFCREN